LLHSCRCIFYCVMKCSHIFLRVEVVCSLNLHLNQKNLNLYKGEFKLNTANPASPTWVKG
jgi:hypothetical protein